MLFYQDLYEDSGTREIFHNWDKNANGVLAEVYNPTTGVLCRQAEQDCDDTELEYYAPEIAFGQIPFDDEMLIEKLLTDSVSADQDQSMNDGYFLAVSAFIQHDTYFPTERAANLWKRSGGDSTTLYGESDLPLPGPGIHPYPRPDCDIYKEKNSCWYQPMRNNPTALVLANSHGSPREIVEVTTMSEVGNNTFGDRKEAIFLSIACSNLALNDSMDEIYFLKLEKFENYDHGNGVLIWNTEVGNYMFLHYLVQYTNNRLLIKENNYEMPLFRDFFDIADDGYMDIYSSH